ncbi:MAG TPA: hypothetical protein ENN40_07650 [Candidatus Aminicenantes bacterium]|nr:hypothetical protein [Candidatus Aminicenantes bacterium]
MSSEKERPIRSRKLSFFVSDLHGHVEKYEKLFERIEKERPPALFLGGDLLPARGKLSYEGGFVRGYLEPAFQKLHRNLEPDPFRVFLILGNDDPRVHEAAVREVEAGGAWQYVHDRWVEWESLRVCGYAFVPPTPFRLKDWERYDVSRFVDPCSTHPQEGTITSLVTESELAFFTIQEGLARLTRDDAMDRTVCLFHAPPHNTGLDRAALDGRKIDHVPLDVHVGSIAIRRFIEERQPLVTLHGHIHESARLTGTWKESLGKTVMLSAAHDGDELCLVRFDPEQPQDATRELI